jgi:hypothetical protein
MGEGEGWERSQKSHDGKKAWSSVNNSILWIYPMRKHPPPGDKTRRRLESSENEPSTNIIWLYVGISIIIIWLYVGIS